jgi:hypothetical protein
MLTSLCGISRVEAPGVKRRWIDSKVRQAGYPAEKSWVFDPARERLKRH